MTKAKYYLDLQTGFIKAHNVVIEKDERYKNRFIPWTAEIPKSGRVDLTAWQTQTAKNIEMTADDIAAFEEFKKFKAGQASAKVTEDPGTPDAYGSVMVPSMETAPMTGDPKPPTSGQRMDKIIATIPMLKKDDFTSQGLPKLACLQELSGISDMEGQERETAWDEFKKHNPDWHPTE